MHPEISQYISKHFKKLKGEIDSNTRITGGFNISLLDFRGGTVVKNLPAHAGNMASIPGLGKLHMPWGK